MLYEKFVENLRMFNLTEYEARTYLALVGRDKATVKEIRELAKIPYSREYDVLEALERRGYVVVQPGRPRLYMAVHPGEILSRELETLSGAASELIEVLSPIYESSSGGGSMQDFIWMIKGRKNVYERLLEMLKGSEEEVLFMGAKALKERGVLERLKSARERGVRVRVLGRVEELKDELEGAGIENISFEHNHSRFVLVDRQELILTGEDSAQVNCALYNRNPGCIKLYLNYFEHIWGEIIPTVP